MKLTKQQISEEEIKELREAFDYDEETGEFYWAKPRSNSCKKGQKADSIDKLGYHILKLNWKRFKAHRVAMAFKGVDVNGRQIDHINGIRHDNRIENLRVVTQKENSKNRRMAKNNSSGVTGVYFCKIMNMWNPRITVDRKRLNLGYYHDKEKAIELRKFAEEVCGFHENHGSNIKPWYI